MNASNQRSPSECDPNLDPPKPKWPDWSGKDVAIVATGPSLTPQDVDLLHVRWRGNVIAINDAGLRHNLPLAVPWADILYAADAAWWRHYQPQFLGLRVSGEPVAAKLNSKGVIIEPAVETMALTMLNRDEPMPRTMDGDTLYSGGHSGFQALGLALALGAKRIALMGYDANARAGRNCHTDRPEKFHRDPPFEQWVSFYRRVPREWPDVEVVNCSLQTAIDAFPVRPLNEVLDVYAQTTDIENW